MIICCSCSLYSGKRTSNLPCILKNTIVHFRGCSSIWIVLLKQHQSNEWEVNAVDYCGCVVHSPSPSRVRLLIVGGHCPRLCKRQPVVMPCRGTPGVILGGSRTSCNCSTQLYLNQRRFTLWHFCTGVKLTSRMIDCCFYLSPTIQ